MVATVVLQIPELELDFLLSIVNAEKKVAVLEKRVIIYKFILGDMTVDLSALLNGGNCSQRSSELDFVARVADLGKRITVLENSMASIQERISILHNHLPCEKCHPRSKRRRC